MTAAAVDRFGRYPSLTGRVVLVSGGATGLGAEFVTQLVDQGAAVGFVDVDVEHGHDLVDRLAARADTAPVFVPVDVRDTAAYTAAIGEIADRLGPIGVLVNNAADDIQHESAAVDVGPGTGWSPSTCAITSSRRRRWFPVCEPSVGARS